jgi:hypothetical protein
MCERIGRGRAYGRNDLIKTLQNTLRGGGRPHTALQDLLVRDGTLSELAALNQDAKHFGYQMTVAERQKYATLAPLHTTAKVILPRLGISQQNTIYFQSGRTAPGAPPAHAWGGSCRVKDYQEHGVATLFGRGQGAASTLLLCRLWRERVRHQLAIALPVDTGTRSASGASLRPHALQAGGRCSGADIIGRRREAP